MNAINNSMKTVIESKEQSLLDFVQVYKKAITNKQCSSILGKINDSGWRPHRWHNYDGQIDHRESDCFNNILSGTSRLLISDLTNTAVENYKKYIFKTLSTSFGFNGMTIPRMNRYTSGQEMQEHVDHITSIFDGEIKGIPTLSVVGLLNDDFEGGEFKFWNKYNMNLEIGDIMIFPSNFLYKHQVDKVTKGIRYSFVSWIY